MGYSSVLACNLTWVVISSQQFLFLGSNWRPVAHWSSSKCNLRSFPLNACHYSCPHFISVPLFCLFTQPCEIYGNSSLVNLAFSSLLSPLNLGAHSLLLGSSLCWTLTDTDHSDSLSRWHHEERQHPGSSVVLGFVVIIISWVFPLHISFDKFGMYSGDWGESWREAAALDSSRHSGFSMCVPRGSCRWVSARHSLGDAFWKWELSLESLERTAYSKIFLETYIGSYSSFLTKSPKFCHMLYR